MDYTVDSESPPESQSVTSNLHRGHSMSQQENAASPAEHLQDTTRPDSLTDVSYAQREGNKTKENFSMLPSKTHNDANAVFQNSDNHGDDQSTRHTTYYQNNKPVMGIVASSAIKSKAVASDPWEGQTADDDFWSSDSIPETIVPELPAADQSIPIKIPGPQFNGNSEENDACQQDCAGAMGFVTPQETVVADYESIAPQQNLGCKYQSLSVL